MGLKAAAAYACFVCACAMATRVIAPLRLDEELWWFYTLACGGVLFGPLLGVLPESWHGEATARQLAVARVVFMLLFLQHELIRPAHPTAPGAFHNQIKTGLPEWTGAARWKAEWLQISPVEHTAKKVAAASALLGVCTQPALLLSALLYARAHMLDQSHKAKVDHGNLMWLPMLLIFALAPCADALALGPWLWRRTTGRAAPPPRRPAEYALPFTAVWLLLATTYLTAGFAKAVSCNFRNGGALDSAFWNSTHMRDVIHKQYFGKCNGAECQLPSRVRYQPLCMGHLGMPKLKPSIAHHSACLLGDNYLFPWLRVDQMLPPWVLQLAAAGSLVWECGMWLCVLRPGPLCALGLLAGFMFHQGIFWLTAISFAGSQDLYLLSLPLLLGWLRGFGGTPKCKPICDSARGRARCNVAMWDTRWRVAAFAMFWGSLQVSPKNLRSMFQYPIAAYPNFCAKSNSDPTRPPVANHMITDVKLTACSSGSLLKSGALVPRRWIELHGGNAATGGCSSAFWRELTKAVQKIHVTKAVQEKHGLRLGNRSAAICAFFSVQYFQLLPHTPLEAQLRQDPPARLVLVNGTAVRAKAGKARSWSSCSKPPASASTSRNRWVVHKRRPHPASASASASTSRNRSVVHKQHPASASTSRNRSVVHKRRPHPASTSTSRNRSVVRKMKH